MLFQRALIALAASISLSSAAPTNEVPDGGYQITNLEDGSVLWTSVTNSTLEPFKTFPEEKSGLETGSAKFQKRETACWGNGLDRAGVDAAAESLRNWAGNGQGGMTTGDRPHFFGYTMNGVLIYYCITRPFTYGNLDRNDVNYALSQMDAVCAPYTASWYGWPGSSELVGKALTSQRVCVGPFN